MATADEYAAWIVKNAAKKGTPEFDTVARAYESAKSEEGGSLGQDIKQGAGNLAAGLVRGAGSIGATLLAPVDIARDALDGKGLSLQSNRQRRADMDAALGTMGAETDSLLYKGGKLAGEIAGTAGAGGAVANTVTRVAPRLAAAAPNVINSIRSAGMTAGPGSVPQQIATRALGGAISGGASAGLVNPEDVGTGALIGAAAPGAIQLAGKAGGAIGRFMRGPAPTPDMVQAAQAAQKAGYVIPPTQVKPSLGNRLLEGYAGKLTTAQNASARNQAITDALAVKELGLAPGTVLEPQVLETVRRNAGQAYDALNNAGTIVPSSTYSQALDKIASPHLTAAKGFPNAKASPVIDLVESLRSPSFDSSSAVAKIKELRSAADDAFRTGNTDIARASKSAAKALEDAVEDHLQKSGATQLLDDFREARKLIAKTYSVEKALNKSTGTVDARKLGAQIDKGKPLSGGLREAGEFANRFPKAANTPERMGSLPQNSPLDFAGGGIASAAMGNVWPLVGAVAGRPVARAAALSGAVQRGLTTQSPNKLAALLRDPELQKLLARSAPIAATQ